MIPQEVAQLAERRALNLRSQAPALFGTIVALAVTSEPLIYTTPAQAEQTCTTTQTPEGLLSTTCEDGGNQATASDPTLAASDTSAPEEPATQTSSPLAPSRPHANTETSTESKRHYNLNMHEYGKILSARGCGIIALSTAISYERQKLTSPFSTWDKVDDYFTKAGIIKGTPYMAKAAPKAAKQYGLSAHETKLSGVIPAIKEGGAVIMLASSSPDGIITRSSHYFESDETKNGKVRIHDPNQHPSREFNNSWRSIKWLKAHHTVNRVWVISDR